MRSEKSEIIKGQKISKIFYPKVKIITFCCSNLQIFDETC